MEFVFRDSPTDTDGETSLFEITTGPVRHFSFGEFPYDFAFGHGDGSIRLFW